MSGFAFPICRKLAAEAYTLQKRGLKGKATADKLGKGITTDQANLLASVGARDAADDAACFKSNEKAVLIALLELQRHLRRKGETGSPKAWMLCRPTGLSVGQIRRATKRIGGDYQRGQSEWNLLHHSVNGHIWLNPAGIAVADAMLAARVSDLLKGEGA